MLEEEPVQIGAGGETVLRGFGKNKTLVEPFPAPGTRTVEDFRGLFFFFCSEYLSGKYQ